MQHVFFGYVLVNAVMDEGDLQVMDVRFFASVFLMPWIQMKGHWLDQAGFSIDTPVTVRVMEGCLVLTTEQQ